MPALSQELANQRREIALDYIKTNDIPSRPIKRFITKHFKKVSDDGLEYFPTLFVKDYFDKQGNRCKKGSKSSLTLKQFEDYYTNGHTTIDGKEWKPNVNAEEAEYYEIRPCFGNKPMAIVDIDGLTSSGDVSLQELVESGKIPECLEDACFFLSRTKSLPHFIFYVDGLPEDIKIGQYVDVFKGFDGDLLFNHAWELIDANLYNYDGDLTTVKWSDLIGTFDPEKTNAKKLLPKPAKATKTKKTKKTEDETDTESVASSADDEKVKNTIDTMVKIVKAILEEENDYFDGYENWSRMVYGFFNEANGTSVEDYARKMADDLSENFCGGTYSEASFNKVWYGAKPKVKEPVKAGTLFKWLNELNPKHPLLKEHINTRLASGKLSADEVRQSDEYLDYREKFELKHFKLLNPVRYIEIENDKDKGRSLIFRDVSDFRERLRDETGAPIFKVAGGLGATPTKFHDLWLEDTYKLKHSKLVFNPSWNFSSSKGDDDTVPVYNAFCGFPNACADTEALAEDKSAFIALMKYLFNDDKVFEYMKCWIASIIQRPEFKTKVAPILYSRTHGTGKNSFVDGVVAILGRNNCGVVESIDDITRNFNAHLCNKLFIYGDEINANAKKVADRLKQVITRPEQNLEKKNVDAVLVDDFTNWLFTTNNENCFKVEEGCRRLLMVHCNEMKQTEYSAKSYAEIKDPVQIKRLFAFFKNYQQSQASIDLYGKFNIGQDVVIETQYKKEMLYENRPAYIQMLYKDPNAFKERTFSSTALYEEAQTYAKKHFLSSNFTSQEFSKQTQRYLEAFKKRGNTCNRYVFPKTKTELLKHLFDVDEKYYRYIYQLDEDFVPEFKMPVEKKNVYGETYYEEE